MIINTWDLSGVLVRVGEFAVDQARKANKCRYYDNIDLENYYNDVLTGIKETVKCLKGFTLRCDTDRRGYYNKVWIAYHGDIVGEPWIIEVQYYDITRI